MISAIIVNYNGKDNLENCLRSIYKYESNIKKEIIVVDNGSSDSSAEMVENLYPDIKLIKNKVNLGTSKARNQAIDISKGECILFLDSDVYLTMPVIYKLKELLDAHADIAVVGPKILNPNKTLQRSCFSDLTLPKSFTDASLLYLVLEFLERTALRKIIFYLAGFLKPISKTNMFTFGNYTQTTDCVWVSSACCMVRKGALERTGLFDEGFFIYFEETDLCNRLRKRSYRVVYYPVVSVVHLFHASLKADPLFFISQRFYSLYYFYKKNYTDKTIFLFRYIYMFALLFSIIIYPIIKTIGLKCNFKTFLKSRLEILKALSGNKV